MKKKALLAVATLAVLTLGFFANVEAQIVEEEYFHIYCGYQCDYKNGEWYCWERNENRCCYFCVEYGDSCGEGSLSGCQECGGNGIGGF